MKGNKPVALAIFLGMAVIGIGGSAFVTWWGMRDLLAEHKRLKAKLRYLKALKHDLDHVKHEGYSCVRCGGWATETEFDHGHRICKDRELCRQTVIFKHQLDSVT